MKNMKRLNINFPIHLDEGVRLYDKKLGVNITTAYILLIYFALEVNNISMVVNEKENKYVCSIN